jgi:hypothetical protein
MFTRGELLSLFIEGGLPAIYTNGITFGIFLS